MAERQRSWWGWGWEDAALSDDEAATFGALLGARLEAPPPELAPAPPLPDLPDPRLDPPGALAAWCRVDARDRARHAVGRAYRDVARSLEGALPRPPDVVAYPPDSAAVAAVLEWAAGARVAVVPFGGGSSVVGGVECDPGDAFAGTMALDLTRQSRVREVDRVSRVARIEAGSLGPQLEAQLRPHRLTLRHFPQSFEFSTLGGWLATRSAGHFATGPTRIDDFVQSLTVVTPAGVIETAPLPASGAGPDSNRLLLGSEGAFGVITSAWMRVQEPPVARAAATMRFESFSAGAQAVQAIVQSGLRPANCRLLDAAEAELFAGGSGRHAVLLVAFESAGRPLSSDLSHALETGRAAGGEAQDAGAGADEAESWRAAFLRAPYVRDGLVRHGFVVETFETACTWNRFADLDAAVLTGIDRALAEVGIPGLVTRRTTHAYPDGVAPYYTVLAVGRPGSRVPMWDEIKRAAAEAIVAAGGTITHHHAVGRDHDPWYRRQRPEPIGAALAAVKDAVDPAGILNPGVLV